MLPVCCLLLSPRNLNSRCPADWEPPGFFHFCSPLVLHRKLRCPPKNGTISVGKDILRPLNFQGTCSFSGEYPNAAPIQICRPFSHFYLLQRQTSIVNRHFCPYLLTQDEKLTPFILNACSSQLRQLDGYGNFRWKLHGSPEWLGKFLQVGARWWWVAGDWNLTIWQASSKATLNVGGLQHFLSWFC